MVKIFADYRENRSPVLRILDTMEVDLTIQELEVGDFILSEMCGCERKTGEDALNSFIGEENGKIFRQCRDLVLAYQKPILLLECDLSDLFIRNIHPAAIWGMLRSIIWIGCPIEFTYNAEGTAKRLFELAKIEQEGNSKEFQPHGNKTKRNPQEQKEYTISSMPNIGTSTAKALLTHFGTIENIMKAGIGELMECDGIGEATAVRIRNLVTEHY